MMVWLRFAALLPIVLGALAGCAGMKSGKAEHPFWPKAPDAARFMYESVIRSELDILRDNATDNLRMQLTGYNPKANPAFVKPYDIAARGGRILVSDSAGTLVHLFDIPRQTLFRIGRGEKGRLIQPSGVTIDEKGNLYVADVKAKRVVMYNPLGHFERELGDANLFARPSDVAVNRAGDRVYVVDFGGIDNDHHRVMVFDGKGEQLFTFGKHGSAPGEFHLASHVAIGPDDNVYVLDAGNFRVQVFDRDGKFLRMWGKVGVNIGDLARPRGIAVDGENNVYVTDATFGNFQIFDAQGRLLMWIGNTGLEDKPGQYALPAGIAVDETNLVYVVDQMYTKIEIIRRLSADESERIAKNLPLNRKLNMPGAPLTPNTAPPPQPATTQVKGDGGRDAAQAAPSTPDQ
jgi:DNA-binding beta-propeller fold protein YncE